MHLMWHIFKKDVRRLYPAVGVTLLLLAALTHFDRWRSDWLASSTEGWLNLLLPMAWACLIALLVHEEPLTGDREFWITRPYRWQPLLASKLVFVILFIHVPALVADTTILALHGFAPVHHIGPLLWKQVLLAVVVTGPAMALATVASNIAHFMLAALAIGGVAGYLAYDSVRSPWVPLDSILPSVTAIPLAAGVVAIVLLQYRSRQTTKARSAGLVSILLAGTVFLGLPPTFAARVRSRMHPASTRPSLSLSPSRPEPPSVNIGYPNNSFVRIAIPVSVGGMMESSQARFGRLSVEVTAPDGKRFRSGPPPPYRDFKSVDLEAYTFPWGEPPQWLLLHLRRSILDRIGDASVNIRGTSEVIFPRRGNTTWMAVGETQAVEGLGRCFSAIPEILNIYQSSMWKVLCESPHSISPLTEVRLWSPETGQDWKRTLGSSSTSASGPRETWISPLSRLQAFFPTRANRHSNYDGDRGMVPADFIPNGKVGITPVVITAWATLDFELSDIKLRDYVDAAPSR